MRKLLALLLLAFVAPAFALTPTVTLTANPVTIAKYGSSTLTWSSTNAVSCLGGWGWSGSMPTSGSKSTGTLTMTTAYWLQCTSSTGTTATATAKVYVGTTAGQPTVTLTANPLSIASGASSVLTWSSTNAVACAASGGWSGNLALSGSESTGPLIATTLYAIGCSGASGTTPASATATVAVATSGQVQRPSYNTGVGLFVLNGKLYDANGNEFRIRGVDRNHYDSNSTAGIANSKANSVRVFVETNFGASVATLVGVMQGHINNKEIAIPTSPYTAGGTQTSGSTSTTDLNSVVSSWVSQASSWKPLERNMIVNIANEWGPSNSTAWRDAYISAIASMRAAGYLGTLMIDTGGWGQDTGDLENYAAAVFNSDPQKNVIFTFHAYGSTTPSNVSSLFASLATPLRSQGVVVAIMEFGPGNNVGPSPTLVTPGEVITNAEANGLGWAAWAWDDSSPFNMTTDGGVYTLNSELTAYGLDVVTNSTYGLQKLAVPATTL